MASGSVAIRALHLEIKSIRKDPIEGVVVDVEDESNLFEWNIGVFGPPKTLYEGGYFKAKMTFPQDYPYSPPSFKFSTKMWHPNIYETGDVCISILHPPTNDPRSGELPQERWNPTQNVRTILLSVISLLNEPNTSSPANVDASVMFKKYQLSGCKEYQTIISKQVLNSRLEAEKEGVHIPSSIEEYCIKHKPHSQSDSNIDICDDWYDDDDDDYLEQDDEEECFDNDDSGNEDQ